MRCADEMGRTGRIDLPSGQLAPTIACSSPGLRERKVATLRALGESNWFGNDANCQHRQQDCFHMPPFDALAVEVSAHRVSVGQTYAIVTRLSPWFGRIRDGATEGGTTICIWDDAAPVAFVDSVVRVSLTSIRSSPC